MLGKLQGVPRKEMGIVAMSDKASPRGSEGTLTVQRLSALNASAKSTTTLGL